MGEQHSYQFPEVQALGTAEHMTLGSFSKVVDACCCRRKEVVEE